jgi:hypothetical protein
MACFPTCEALLVYMYRRNTAKKSESYFIVMIHLYVEFYFPLNSLEYSTCASTAGRGPYSFLKYSYGKALLESAIGTLYSWPPRFIIIRHQLSFISKCDGSHTNLRFEEAIDARTTTDGWCLCCPGSRPCLRSRSWVPSTERLANFLVRVKLSLYSFALKFLLSVNCLISAPSKWLVSQWVDLKPYRAGSDNWRLYRTFGQPP